MWTNKAESTVEGNWHLSGVIIAPVSLVVPTTSRSWSNSSSLNKHRENSLHLLSAEDTVAVCPWTRATLRWTLGGNRKELCVTHAQGCQQCQTDFWGNGGSAYTDWGMPHQLPSCGSPSRDDGIVVLTPGHFCIGRTIEALPDPAFTYQSVSILTCWHLCQALVCHHWQCWSANYLDSLKWSFEWYRPSAKYLQVYDIVVLTKDNVIPARWPLTRVVAVHKGDDELVCVITVKTSPGTYRRPVHKVVLLPTKSDKQ